MTSETVKLSYAFSISDPGTISISNPESTNSLKLIATIKQDSSPFLDRPITLLTKYTVLDTTSPDAFVRKWLNLPYDVDNPDNKIRIYPRHFRVYHARLGGDPDMRKREGYPFITVPPPGQGAVKVSWSMAPEHILRFYTEDESLTERLKRFKPGQTFKIEPPLGSRSLVSWWTFGSIGTDLKDKKFTPWSLPNNLAIIRALHSDEGDDIDSCLIDYVDLKTLGQLGSYQDRSDSNVPPRTREWKVNGWVFGEPMRGIEVSCSSSAVFQFVE